VLVEEAAIRPADQHIEQNSHDFQQTLSKEFKNIQRRNEAMLFYNFPTRPMTPLGNAIPNIQVMSSAFKMTIFVS
jgi:hypothetical protein